MLEVPSVLFLVPELQKAGVQFFSIGTNDLSQYLLASDRLNPLQKEHTSPLALARALQFLSDLSSVPISVCGNLAADPHWAALLVGLGIEELSIPMQQIPLIKEKLLTYQHRLPSLQKAVQDLLQKDEETFLNHLETF